MGRCRARPAWAEAALLRGRGGDGRRRRRRCRGEAREAERQSGLTDEQWFALVEPAILARLDPAQFARVLRLGEAYRNAEKTRIGDPIWRFTFGLGVVLDGIAALIAAKRAAA